MCDCVMWPKKNPSFVRVEKINSLRSDIFRHIEDFQRAIETFEEYGLSSESECVNNIIKDLRKHEEMLNECIRESDSEIKEAQDSWRKWESEDSKDSEESDSKVECPECGWSGDKTDECPDCWYKF